MVIDGIPFTSPNETARGVLTHELTHLALAAAAPGRQGLFPKWFHEGLACWAADAPHPGDYERLDLRAALSSLPRLADLARDFPDRPRDAALAYLTAEHFVRYLATRFGDAAVRELVVRTRLEQAFDRAFGRVFGRSVETAELEWHEWLKENDPPGWVLLRQVSLFAVMALLVVVAFVAMKRRSQRIKEAWDREGLGF